MSFFVLFSKHCIIRPCVFSKLWAKSADKASLQLKMLQSFISVLSHRRINNIIGHKDFSQGVHSKSLLLWFFVLFTLTFWSITLTFRSITLILFQSKYHTKERKNDYRVYLTVCISLIDRYFLDFFQFPNDVCGFLYEQGRISWNVWSYSLWRNAWKVSMH